MNFAKRLKELREEKQLSQQQFADILGTYKATISRYESGQRTPTIDFVRDISIKFHVSMDWLAGESNDKEIKVINMKDVPELKHISNGYIGVIQEAYESGLTPEEIKEILEIAGKIRKRS